MTRGKRHCWRCAAALDAPPPTTCAACGQEHYNNPKPAAEALLVSAGELLLIRRAVAPFAGCWDIPGGFCEPGEHPAETAVRELREETGHHGTVLEQLTVLLDDYGDPQPDGMQETTLNISYLLKPTEAVPVTAADSEASEQCWFALDALPTEIAFPGHALEVLAVLCRRLSAGTTAEPSARSGPSRPPG